MAIPMAVTVRSIARQASGPIAYHIVAPDFSAEQRAALVAATNPERGDTVEFLELRDDFSALHAGVEASRAYYYRLALPQLLPQLARILYLDSDLLVRGDLRPLWERVSASTAPLQACYDLQRYISARMLPVFPEYGLTEQDAYFNSGVLGMNLDLCRAEGVTQQVVNFLQKHGAACPLWDQGAINALYSRKIEPLPKEWNTIPTEADRETKIVHFCTFKKPFARPKGLLKREAWQLAAWQTAMKNSLFFREYFEVLDETVYRGWRPRSAIGKILGLLPTQLLQGLREKRRRRAATASGPRSH
jgi:lipopolysaccharide biosynthesis glycosyltransferase